MATRLYMPSSGTAAVSPAYSSGWEDQSIASRLKCVKTKISSAMTTVSFTDSDDTDRDVLFRQYTSDPIAAQTIAAQTVKIQMRCAEVGQFRNMFLAWAVKVMSNDGSIERGVLVALQRDGLEATVTTLTNRSDSATSSQVVAQQGDRIVIEVGMGGDPTLGSNHDSSLSIGDDSGSDLPEDDTSTDAFNPWVEFANTVTWHYTSSLSGSQPAAVGSITRASGVFSRSIAAAVASGTATVTRTAGAFSRAIAGVQPAAVGVAFKSGLGSVFKAVRVTTVNIVGFRQTSLLHFGSRITTIYTAAKRIAVEYLVAIRKLRR